MKLKPLRRLIQAISGTVLFLSLNLLLVVGFPTIAHPFPGVTQLAQGPSAVSYFQSLAKADELYRSGDRVGAEAIYRKVKPAFSKEGENVAKFRPVYEAEKLPPGGQAYWREYQRSEGRPELRKGALIPLQFLVQNYPEFVPGHLQLARELKADGQNEKALNVLEQASSLHPDDPDLLKARIEALAEAEQFLEASIAARQFTLIYPDYAEAPEFVELSRKYRDRYRSRLRQEILGQSILGGITGIVKGALTNDWSAGLSSVQMIAMLGESESKMGQKVAEAYKQKLSLLDDQAVLDYVKGIGGRLTPLMGRDDLEYEYYIVKDNAINAFALPGGKVFVNTGVILNTNSEAELAGLLGHEISHAALSHGYQRMANASFLSNLQGLIPFGDLVTNLVAAQYSREHEKQADILGSRVLHLNGYAADGLRNLMVTLRQQSGTPAKSLFATHPAPTERVRYLESLIQQNGYNRYAYEGVKKHQEIQNRIKGLPVEKEQGQSVASQPQLQENRSQATGTSSKKPASGQSNVAAARNDVFTVNQTQNSVTITLEATRTGASIRGKLIIENKGDRAFGFVPVFVKVLNAEGESIEARATFKQQTLVQPGEKIEGQLFVFNRSKGGGEDQTLTLVLTEGTSGGRLFRMSF